jgi:hypothetical protein
MRTSTHKVISAPVAGKYQNDACLAERSARTISVRWNTAFVAECRPFSTAEGRVNLTFVGKDFVAGGRFGLRATADVK